MFTPSSFPLRRRWIAGSVALVLSAARLQSATLWNETVSGDLSDNQATPNLFAVSVGANSIIGTVGGANTQDWIALTVPSGFRLSSVILAAYSSADVQGFTGFAAGTSFAGSAFVPGSYLGFSHFGTAAANGSLPPANLVGADLLPIMANPAAASGALGFTPPLPAGSYTFLIQQLGSATSYQFDYGVTAVPEPTSITLLVLGGAISLRRRSRNGK